MEELDILENSVDSEDFADESLPIQAPKPIRKKRTPTPKQLEVLEKAREKMVTNAREKRIKKKLEDEAIEKEVQRRFDEYKSALEQKVIKKAIAVKKREILKQSALDEIEDEDIPMEKVVETVRKTSHKKKVEEPSPPPPTHSSNTVDWGRNPNTPLPPAKKYIFV
jgi:hypothetical protein